MAHQVQGNAVAVPAEAGIDAPRGGAIFHDVSMLPQLSALELNECSAFRSHAIGTAFSLIPYFRT